MTPWAEALESRRLLAAGDLDPTFGDGGKVLTHLTGATDDRAHSVVIQPDGKYVVAGQVDGATTSRPNNGSFAVTRFNRDGTLDPSFGSGGKALVDFSGYATAHAVALAPDNKIVVAGQTDRAEQWTERLSDFGVVRLNPDGSPDASFGTDGRVTIDFHGLADVALGVAVRPDGTVVVAGHATTRMERTSTLPNPIPAIALAQLTPGGELDGSFDGDGKVTTEPRPGAWAGASAVVLDGSGRAVVAGYAIEWVPAQRRKTSFALARYGTDGALDSSFGDSGIVLTEVAPEARAQDLALAPDGKLVAVGTGFTVARYNDDGGLDRSFDGDGFAAFNVGATRLVAHAVHVFPDGRIAVGGSADNAIAVLRLNDDGTRDGSFGGAGVAYRPHASGFDIAIDVGAPGGAVVAVGEAYPRGGRSESSPRDFLVCRFTPAGAPDPGFAGGELTVHFAAAGTREAAEAAAVQPDGKVIVGATLQTGGARGTDFGLLRYLPDGRLDTSFGANGIVRTDFGERFETLADLLLQPDGKVIAAGYARELQLPLLTSVTQFMLVRYNPDGSLDEAFGDHGKWTAEGVNGNLAASGALTALALMQDGRIVAAGSASIPGDAGHHRWVAVARLLPDGRPDPSFGDGDGIAVARSTTVHESSGAVVNDVAVASGGEILTGGSEGFLGFQLCRFTVNGEPDATFGGDGFVETRVGVASASVGGLDVTGEGKVIAAGYGLFPGVDFAVVRYHADGNFDDTFGDGGIARADFGGDDPAHDMVLLPGGAIATAGLAEPHDADDRYREFALAWFTPDGVLDPKFGGDGKVTTRLEPTGVAGSSDEAWALALAPDGHLVAAGTSHGAIAVARYEGLPPPRVEAAFLSSSAWAPAFRGALPDADGYAMVGDVAAGDGASLPWRGLDRVSVRFDRDAAVRAADLRVVRPDRSVHTAAHFAYDAAGRTATWTLARPMASGNVRVELSLPSGVTWSRDLHVLPGDVDRNDAVNALDVAEVKRRLASSAAGGGRDSAFSDVTGDGRVNALDLAAVKAGLTVQLPAPRAAAPAVLLRSSVTRELFGDSAVPE